jgi:chromosome segregation ATPase
MTTTEAFEIAWGVALAKLDEKNDRIKQLEAELAEAKANILQIHKDLGCELFDPNGTIWEHAAKVQAENAEAKELLVRKDGTIDLWKNEVSKLQRELADANEARNAWENEALQSRITIASVLKTAEGYELQIACGELVPASVAATYYETHIDRVMPLEVFAAEQARKDAQ